MDKFLDVAKALRVSPSRRPQSYGERRRFYGQTSGWTLCGGRLDGFGWPSGLSGLAFAIAVLVWLANRPPFQGVLTPAHLHDLGNLTLAFVMLWAYVAFSQYLLIWAGNLPEEIPWYVHRLQFGWQAVGLLLRD